MICFILLIYCLSSATASELLSRHRRSWIIDSFDIEEEHPGPFPYELGKVNIERKYQVYFELYGQGVDEEPTGVISINKSNGTLCVHKPVDFEKTKTLKLRFVARKMDISLDTKLGLEISIKDINDNPPLFQKDLYEISVDEDKTQGSHLLTVLAEDRDQKGTLNSTFHYEIKSVSPNVPDTEFFINELGVISFKGCLNHEVADMFTILVEAIDHGEVIRLSSSTTVVIHVRDGNHHLPVISGQTGTGKVKENVIGDSPLRLHVTDKDTPNSWAWRARYTIHGDEAEHFRIETDLDNNDGILTVVKPLNFEDGAQRELLISVENEAPYYLCRVKERTPSGLWKVDTIKGHDASDAGQPESVKVTIDVEDINDPPVFSVAIKEVLLEENAPIGTWVEKLTAVDPDSTDARDFFYTVGKDPAGWVTVDPHTGNITTIKTPDRESPHVVNGLYTILLHAVDNGNPPMTGTATLHVHVTDENDNMPQITVDHLDFCVSDGPTTTNISAFDLDGNPYGGPFNFELLGDVKGKWTLNPAYGYTAGLVKEPGVYTGEQTIQLKISDMQGVFVVYNLSVTVCGCSVKPNCRVRQSTTSQVSLVALGIMLSSLLLVLFLLLMVVSLSTRKYFIPIEPDDSSEKSFHRSNTEKQGVDCKLGCMLTVPAGMEHHNPSNLRSHHNGSLLTMGMEQSIYSQYWDDRLKSLPYQFTNTRNQTTWNALIDTDYNLNQFEQMDTNFIHENYIYETKTIPLLHQKLALLQDNEKDFLCYERHIYTEERNSECASELESITISDDDSFLDTLEYLGPRFNQLASICKPPQI